MHAFRVTVNLASGGRCRYTGLFADGFEAALQALADFPEARGISVICLRGLP